MRWLTLVFFGACLARATADTSGAWSPVDHGLRARLFTAAATDRTRDATYDLYVEFENVPVIGNLGPIEEARTFVYSEFNWEIHVTGPDGRALTRIGPLMVDYVSGGQMLTLPPGGKLSFPIGIGGDTAPRTWTQPNPAATIFTPLQGGYLHLNPMMGWIIPQTGAYYLAGTFSSGKEVEYGGRINWKEVLTLPSVLVPAR